MASFYITGLSTTPRILIDGDYGYIGVNGALLVDTTNAIYSGAGTVEVVVDGRVFNDYIYRSAIWLISYEASVEIGSLGGVSSAQGSAVDISAEYRALVTNAGTVRANGAGIYLSENDGDLYGFITNTGLIDSYNHGIALELGSGGAKLLNTGVVQSQMYGIYAGYYGSTAEIEVRNSGVLSGVTGGYFGSSGTDTLINTGEILGDVYLGLGNDVFDGRGGTVAGSVNGAWGDDLYIIDDGSIVIEEYSASDGNDTVESAVSYALGDTIEELTLIGGENIDGEGNALSNRMRGNMGDNRLSGGDETDYLFGRGGDDVLRGEADDDYLSANSGHDTLEGGSGNDTLLGGAGADHHDGGEGQDRASYYNSQTRGVLADLEDPSRNSWIAAGDSYDSVEDLWGSEYDDFLYGDAGANEITGDRGADVLWGRDGNDYINGMWDDDRISGNKGDDTLRGGLGADTFNFWSDNGADIITDYTDGSDKIRFIIGGLGFGDLGISQSGADAVIDYGSGQITLLGVSAATLDASDFLFV
ncbi:calcium-binding protein [Cribrihabitans sp. XS_ASV171]